MDKKSLYKAIQSLSDRDKQELFESMGGSSQKRPKKPKPEKDLDKAFNVGFKEAREAAAAQGKGIIGQTLAGFKGGSQKREQYQMATIGTKRSLERMFALAGIQMGDFGRKNWEKKGTPEEIKKAREALGLDKKEAEEKKAKEERQAAREAKRSERESKRASVGEIDKTVIDAIFSTKKLVEGIAKVTLVKRGFKAEIDEKGKVVYRSTREGTKGRYAKEEEASAIYTDKLSMKRSQEQRESESKRDKETGLSLKSAIGADETPQAKMAETLQGILKSLGQGDMSIHEKLDKIIEQGGGDGGGIGLGAAVDLLGSGRGGRLGKIGRRVRAITKLGKAYLIQGIFKATVVPPNMNRAVAIHLISNFIIIIP